MWKHARRCRMPLQLLTWSFIILHMLAEHCTFTSVCHGENMGHVHLLNVWWHMRWHYQRLRGRTRRQQSIMGRGYTATSSSSRSTTWSPSYSTKVPIENVIAYIAVIRTWLYASHWNGSFMLFAQYSSYFILSIFYNILHVCWEVFTWWIWSSWWAWIFSAVREP